MIVSTKVKSVCEMLKVLSLVLFLLATIYCQFLEKVVKMLFHVVKLAT